MKSKYSGMVGVPLPVHDRLSPEELEAIRAAFERESNRTTIVWDGALLWVPEEKVPRLYRMPVWLARLAMALLDTFERRESRLRWWFWPGVLALSCWIGLTIGSLLGGAVVTEASLLWIVLGLLLALVTVCGVKEGEEKERDYYEPPRSPCTPGRDDTLTGCNKEP